MAPENRRKTISRCRGRIFFVPRCAGGCPHRRCSDAGFVVSLGGLCRNQFLFDFWGHELLSPRSVSTNRTVNRAVLTEGSSIVRTPSGRLPTNRIGPPACTAQYH